MSGRFVGLLLLIGAVASVSGAASGAEADFVAADEQMFRAAHLGTDGPALLDFFRKFTLTDADRVRIQALIKQLGDGDFEVREQASAALVELGPKAVALLRPAVKDPDPEIARRADAGLRELEQVAKTLASNRGLLPAAARLVAARKPAGAAQVLMNHLLFADPKTAVEATEWALVAVALREGQADPALAAALTAANPLPRAIAGVALARANLADKSPVRKLLRDPDPGVRLQVGLALAVAEDSSAVPVLIDLLAELPPERLWSVENLLQQLAGDKSPAVRLGTDAAGRGLCRDAWAAWWCQHGATLEIAALLELRPQLGYTLIVTPDAPDGKKIVEVERDGKVRWQMSGVFAPRSAELLPGERILVVAGGVSERNLGGEVLWQKPVAGAMQCQRLANGNTFVVSTMKMVEFDPEGKETVLYTPNFPKTFLVAGKKLPSGRMIVIDSDGICLRLDAEGKELSHFAVGKTSERCLEILPTGRLLVPKFFDNKIVEYDSTGEVLWESPCRRPLTAQRLPNGNTLVAAHEPGRVVELDRGGKVVWEHKTGTSADRPFFASRR